MSTMAPELSARAWRPRSTQDRPSGVARGASSDLSRPQDRENRTRSDPSRSKLVDLGRKSRFWSDSRTIFHGFWYRNRFRNGLFEKLFPNRFSKAFSKVFSMIFRAFLSNLLFCRHSRHLGFYRVKRFLGILVDDAFDESFS